MKSKNTYSGYLLRVLSFIIIMSLLAPMLPQKVFAADSYDEVYAHNKRIYDDLCSNPALPNFYRIPRAREEEREIIDLANSIVRGISDDYAKVQAIHDWVAGNIWYDRDVRYNGAERAKAQWPVCVLENKRAVCEGYVNLSTALLRAAGIPARYVAGKALNTDGDHVWTEAFAGGRWIIFDATFDSDNKYEAGVYSDKKPVKQTYFDMSIQEMSKTHRYDDGHADIWYRNNFSFNTTMTGVTIPDGITSIGYNAFLECENLTWVDIPDSVASIARNAFSGCDKLKRVKIPNGVTIIEEKLFQFCYDLESADIPSTVTAIGNSAFNYCRNLRGITLPDGVKSIGEYTFAGCHSLTSVLLPESVVSIGAGAFERCFALTSIMIPNRVTRIEADTFQLCDSLTSVTIPESVTYIDNNAFGKPIMRNLTIHGAPGSASEAFAKNNGVKFAPLGTAGAQTTVEQPSPWAANQVYAAISENFVPQDLRSGYTRATTRAEFCALAVALYEKINGEITQRSTFADTSDTNVQKAAAIGVVTGVGGNRFDPDAKLTREQAAVMLARLAEAIGKPLAKTVAAFADNGRIASWAIDGVGQVHTAGIMNGVGENTFAPQDPYTREQSIVTIMRLYDVVK